MSKQCIIRTANGSMTVSPETRLMSESRELFLGEITSEAATTLIQQIKVLRLEDKKTPIKVNIQSTGGNVPAGLSIIDYIQAISDETPIQTFCDGFAYSMAAIIFASGTGGRYMFPNSELMLHEPLIDSIGGSTSSIEAVSHRMIHKRDQLNKLLVQFTGRSLQEVEAATSFDNYLDAEESCKFGLADEIITKIT